MHSLHRVLRAALNEAVRPDKMLRNPVTRASPPRLAERELEPLTHHDAARLIAVANGQPGGARWSVALAIGLVLVEPSPGPALRRIAMPTALVDLLKAHGRPQLAQRLRVGTMWEEHGLVFCKPTGRPIDPRSDWAGWKALLAEAGVRDARLHDARHAPRRYCSSRASTLAP